MPVFGRTGHIAAGIAGAGVSVDRTWIDPGGGTCWIDDETALYQTTDGQDHWWLRTHNRVTQMKTDIEPKRGASFIVAGGGRWAATLVGYGTYGSLGLMPLAGVRAAGFDGTIAICEDYQAGLGVSLYAPDGTVTRGAALSPCYGLRVLGPDDAIYIETSSSGPIVTLKGRRFKQHGPAMAPALFICGGEDWVSYYTFDFGIIAHPAYAPDDPRPLLGYVLGPPENAYNYDVRVLPEAIQIVYSTTQGERPQDIVVVDIPLTQARVDLSPPPPIPPPDVTVTYRPLTGTAPLNVEAQMFPTTGSGPVTAIRWLKNGAIDGGSDVETHTYGPLTQPISYALAVRVAGPGGQQQTPDQIVTVQAPVVVTPPVTPPEQAFTLGLNAMFGEDIQDERMAGFVERGVRGVRTWIGPPAESADIVAQFARFPTLQPLYIIRAKGGASAELARVPVGSTVEMGNEPNIGDGPAGAPKMSPAQYAAWAESLRLCLHDRNLMAYWGCPSNLNPDGLAWLREVIRLCPWMERVSVHDYDRDLTAARIPTVLSMLGGRRFRVTETGVKCGPQGYKVPGGFLKGPKVLPITEQQQLDYLRGIVATWRRVPTCTGIDFYQECSGTETDYGLNALDGHARLAWQIFTS